MYFHISVKSAILNLSKGKRYKSFGIKHKQYKISFIIHPVSGGRKESIMKLFHEIAEFCKVYGDRFPKHMYIGK